jgi:hypothetical protein
MAQRPLGCLVSLAKIDDVTHPVPPRFVAGFVEVFASGVNPMLLR